MSENGFRSPLWATLLFWLFCARGAQARVLARRRILTKSNPSLEDPSRGQVEVAESRDLRQGRRPEPAQSLDRDSNETEGLEERFIDSGASRVPITFKKCKTKVDQVFDVVKAHATAEGQEGRAASKSKKRKALPREETLYVRKPSAGQPLSRKVFFGVKVREPFDWIKGAYVFYNKALPNKAELGAFLGLLPEYGGCKRKFSLSGSKALKSVELLYEHLPFWVHFFEMTQREATNLTMVEMVHQLYLFFLKLFPTGLYVKNFDSRFIGVRVVRDVNEALGLPAAVYQQRDLAFVFKNVEAFEYHCRFRKESDFRHLERLFEQQRGRQFKIKNESQMDVCHQMNLFNLLKILEVALFQSAGIARAETDFFVGCLEEAADAGRACPSVLLAVLGKDVNKVRFDFSKAPAVHLRVLTQLRANLLAYTTHSFKAWLGAFLKDLLLTFRKRPVRVVPSVRLDAGRVRALLAKFGASVHKIEEARESSGDQQKFAEELAQIKGALAKLLAIQTEMGQKLAQLQPAKTAPAKGEIGKVDGLEDLSEIQASASQKSRASREESPARQSQSPKLSSQASDKELEDITQTLQKNLKDVEEVDELQTALAREDQRESGQRPLTDDVKYEFQDDEQLAFVQRVDNRGMEYLSMEINLNMINPKDFGFDDYRETDEGALHAAVQTYFLEQLRLDPSLKGLVLELDQSNFLI